ncbi:MAG TPA: hypothetical protein VGO60_19045 [Iamia sp.]|nr:hypothetical protein [Iamia sp.]
MSSANEGLGPLGQVEPRPSQDDVPGGGQPPVPDGVVTGVGSLAVPPAGVELDDDLPRPEEGVDPPDPPSFVADVDLPLRLGQSGGEDDRPTQGLELGLPGHEIVPTQEHLPQLSCPRPTPAGHAGEDHVQAGVGGEAVPHDLGDGALEPDGTDAPRQIHDRTGGRRDRDAAVDRDVLGRDEVRPVDDGAAPLVAPVGGPQQLDAAVLREPGHGPQRGSRAVGGPGLRTVDPDGPEHPCLEGDGCAADEVAPATHRDESSGVGPGNDLVAGHAMGDQVLEGDDAVVGGGPSSDRGPAVEIHGPIFTPV